MSLLTCEGPLAPNIDDRGVSQRRRLGVAALGTGAAATLILALVGTAWSALTTFPVFWVGALALLQAREKT
jgi:hypothetical protein